MMPAAVPSIPLQLTAPFPWFGGKRRVAAAVWARFGEVASYNEPFAGSLAVLLGRPHEPRIETVNDLDCYLANFWRALQAEPDVVARYADAPVNEADLHARHRWLVDHRPEHVMSDPFFYDARIAGWWVWGQCLWIGSGWCESRNARVELKRPKLRERGTDGVAYQQQFERNGQGTVHQRRRPALTNDNGVTSFIEHRRWQGGGQAGGSGVHAPRLARQVPDLSGDSGASGRGIHALRYTDGLYTYMTALAQRLRRVRVCCGDWSRVLTPSVTSYIGLTGVFLDPPYAHDLRARCYSEDHDISAAVRDWAVAHGDDPQLRIALCGYEGEHQMPDTWSKLHWKAHGGYSRSTRGVANRALERIWFSPHCLDAVQGDLFEAS